MRAAAAAACETEAEDEEGAAERAECGRWLAVDVCGEDRCGSVGLGWLRPCSAVHCDQRCAGSGRGDGLPRVGLRVYSWGGIEGGMRPAAAAAAAAATCGGGGAPEAPGGAVIAARRSHISCARAFSRRLLFSASSSR